MNFFVNLAVGALTLMAFSSLTSVADAAEAPSGLDKYNVVWSSPGKDASGSMPIGNGEVGLNAWVEENGDLVFYISRTDAWSECNRLLKLGRVRVHLSPSPIGNGQPFRQELVLRDGQIVIQEGDTELRLFVDAAAPVVYITGTSKTPRTVKATYETWRTEKRTLSGEELGSSWTMQGAPAGVDVWESADVVKRAEFDADTVLVYHRNAYSCVPFTLKHQGLESIASTVRDPIVNRIFGASMTSSGLIPDGANSLKSPDPIRSFEITLATQSVQAATPAMWERQLPTPIPEDLAARRTSSWWREFWSRSWIHVEGEQAVMPTSTHSLRIGMDSGGGSRFRGEIRGAKATEGAATVDAIAAMAAGQPEVSAPPPDISLARGFTVSAWIKPAAGESGRIFDKITPGGSDGFLFDTYPGDSLRLIVGSETLSHPGGLKPGEWQHVAATVDARGVKRVYLNGKLVLEGGGPDVTRAYVLQRWMTACAGRGAYPIKFNGSIFTVEPKYVPGGPNYNPDWRRWGDCYWWQNTRLPYGPMAARGDFDEMRSLFNLYREVLPLCEARAKLYHGAGGAYFPETMTNFGTYANNDYGWERTGHNPNEVMSPWWQYAWQQGLELTAVMLDYYEYTEDTTFLNSELIPMANAVLRYYDTRFKRDRSGKLIISPTQAVETYWSGVVNDTPSVAGLNDVCDRLLRLPVPKGADRAFWQRMKAAAPPVPVRNGHIQPAAEFNPQRTNVENPELYALWPFRVYGIGRPDLETAVKTFQDRPEKASIGWQYDGQCAAIVGLADQAKRILLGKCDNANTAFRFPVMWGPNYDWLPDQDHGSNIMLTLQTMLLQCDGKHIYLLPAWPKEWNVTFKLRAPGNTTVECEYVSGKIKRLDVSPPSRRRDVVLPGKVK